MARDDKKVIARQRAHDSQHAHDLGKYVSQYI